MTLMAVGLAVETSDLSAVLLQKLLLSLHRMMPRVPSS